MVSQAVVRDDNPVFEIARNFIRQTARCIFLTGKAGTGKTTFLREIRQTTPKKTVVVAPTGVAAINAGGTTIHSFFQLPFSPFVPVAARSSEELSDRYALLRNLRIEQEKRNLFRELDLLIIDEVSMVRCDVLDAIDVILRHFRRREHVPFGGVQVLLIGDLYQLPPVVQQSEWNILGEFYDSPFFFDARVMKEAEPIYIELKHIYRQSDPAFIALLNKIRNNEISGEEIELLNQRYVPDFDPQEQEGYITLTTHNAKADQINFDALDALPGETSTYAAEVEGDFPERNFPTERSLKLKPGAQVMFIKNDVGPVKRYYNGKLGKVKAVTPALIVEFPDEGVELEVEKETWRNVRYSFNAVTGEVEEEVLGVFTQYGIRLAWAITIHKSQGLTFDNVVIDAGQAFAPGQVYVALSRCTSLEGIVLHSRISPYAIRTDHRVITFSRKERSLSELGPLLTAEQQQYELSKLLDVFDWSILSEELHELRIFLSERKNIDREEAMQVVDDVAQVVTEMNDITTRFAMQLRGIAHKQEFTLLVERVEAGVSYFSAAINERILPRLKEYDDSLKSLGKVKRVRRRMKNFIALFESFASIFGKAKAIAHRLRDEHQ
jgi:ATP-dependent exoDNAse (exonuclease V) alpha subunit